MNLRRLAAVVATLALVLSSASAVLATPAVQPSIEVQKTADPTNLPAGGGSVTYTYLVWNDGDIPLFNVTVSDDKCASVTYISGDTNGDDLLDLTETWTYTCTMDITETTTNTVVARGYYGQGYHDKVTDTEQATVTVDPYESTDPSPSAPPSESTDPSPSAPPSGSTEPSSSVPPSESTDPSPSAPPSGSTEPSSSVPPSGSTEPSSSVPPEESPSGSVGTETDVPSNPPSDGGVEGETDTPTAPPTDGIGSSTSDPGASLPLLLSVLGIIVIAALVVTPTRKRR